ncbi:MAG: putative bifunctional diguanylate cyclase/phosphodiesterase [Panacagrimonas sp.]
MKHPIKGLSVLLVEDNHIDAQLLIELLDMEPADERPQVTHVTSVGDALAQLAAQSFDCVLLDLGLPDGDGVENVARIRMASQHTTIVVMTGLDDDRRAAEALLQGAQEYLVKGRLDHAALVRQLRHAVQRNRLLVDLDRERVEQKLRAGQDGLTGLANRQRLADRAQEAIVQAQRRGERLALVFIDLDGFKGVNDRYGHALGDAALIEVARVLQAAARAGDTVARLGGDEFVVLQCPIGDDASVRDASVRLVQAVASIGTVGDCAVRLGASAGVAIYPDHGNTLELLLHHADSQMYAVKHAGGGGARVCAADSTRLPRIETTETVLVYQPWFSPSGEPAGVESLLRQRRGPDHIPPAALLREAARREPDSGLTHWVLRTACAQWTRWYPTGSTAGRLGVNVSANEAAQAGFPAMVESVLDSERLPGTCLQIEIAEHLIQPRDERLRENLRALRARGIRVVIDRYGRDVASLRLLADLPIDGIKLDTSVVTGLSTEHRQQWALVAGVVHAAYLSGVEVFAVGVEHENDARSLLRLGKISLQGAWLAAPTGADKLPEALAAADSRARLLGQR